MGESSGCFVIDQEQQNSANHQDHHTNQQQVSVIPFCFLLHPIRHRRSFYAANQLGSFKDCSPLWWQSCRISKTSSRGLSTTEGAECAEENKKISEPRNFFKRAQGQGQDRFSEHMSRGSPWRVGFPVHCDLLPVAYNLAFHPFHPMASERV